jgi:hypothetical protein
MVAWWSRSTEALFGSPYTLRNSIIGDRETHEPRMIRRLAREREGEIADGSGQPCPGCEEGPVWREGSSP